MGILQNVFGKGAAIKESPDLFDINFFISDSGIVDVTPNLAHSLYTTIPSIRRAVDTIAGATAEAGFTDNTGKPIELLNNGATLRHAMVEYMLNGTLVVLYIGNISSSPAKIHVMDTRAVSFSDKQIQINYEGSEIVFNEDEKGRFINGLFELGVAITRKKDYLSSYLGRGESPLSPIMLSATITDYIRSLNAATLRNGGMPSGIIATDSVLTTDAKEDLKKKIKSMGGGGKGKVLTLQGKFDYKDMTVSNREGDYLKLDEYLTNVVLTTLGVPLPLVSGANMTYNNYNQAQAVLYRETVLPRMSAITPALNPLLKRLNVKNIIPNVSNIEALKDQKAEEVAKLAKAGILTINELRARIGYDPVAGGDEVQSPNSYGSLQPQSGDSDE